ncbi:MAG: UDP-2,3-diacylglucosamine diphosphatase [Flavobacteriaceae bacterium]|jgi:UDP-2,3-diacylglucosamine hydrolase|nr:UDP-2,3-diacylglucosamine diphosphatase [Flavobacteriaceae bacterium]MBT4113755.1 UDP-2,3-diacylglucosamine diphosphatase [Flavobacteriaceae bacterium]MBT4614183.1 UDP-2,3-diacylglucosamine diphosphatase [Flavobacteriaceae bacterium]MBT7881660.1 UDP-2,3-diacylglucosamine diphosphatase [Flavobacteriaceae bacterium]
MKLTQGKKIYFSSDNHLGAPNLEESLVREKKFVSWLDTIKKDAEAIFLVGDIFDFWFEYNEVVPKGFTRTLGKLAEISDAGISIHYFAGNHDMWLVDYFQKELNLTVHNKPKIFTINDKKFFVGHGDGLGPGDKSFKIMKKIFKNPFFNWCFRCVHPDLGIKLGKYLSNKNRLKSSLENLKFNGNENEWLTKYCKEKLKNEHYDYFIFGHRHIPLEIKLSPNSTYINLGDWITHFSYAVFDGHQVLLDKD